VFIRAFKGVIAGAPLFGSRRRKYGEERRFKRSYFGVARGFASHCGG
jgi:hypothetical protein